MRSLKRAGLDCQKNTSLLTGSQPSPLNSGRFFLASWGHSDRDSTSISTQEQRTLQIRQTGSMSQTWAGSLPVQLHIPSSRRALVYRRVTAELPAQRINHNHSTAIRATYWSLMAAQHHVNCSKHILLSKLSNLRSGHWWKGHLQLYFQMKNRKQEGLGWFF